MRGFKPDCVPPEDRGLSEGKNILPVNKARKERYTLPETGREGQEIVEHFSDSLNLRFCFV